MSERDVLILGAGPAGMFCATMCGMVGLKSTIIDCAGLGGQCANVYPDKYIYDIAGFPKILAMDLVTGLKEQMMRFEPELILDTEVVGLRKNGVFTVIGNNIELSAPVVVLANGSGTIKPIRPLLDNVYELERAGLITYHLKDMQKFAGKTVIVGGGGDSALDWCIALSEAGAEKIYLVHRRTKLRGAESLQNEALALPQVHGYLGYDIESVAHENSRLKMALKQSNTGESDSLDADYFVPCYGFSGDKGFMQNMNFEPEKNNINKIIVNPGTMESSVPGFYAIGDGCAYANKPALIVISFGEAALCAHHAREHYFSSRPFTLEHSSSKFK